MFQSLKFLVIIINLVNSILALQFGPLPTFSPSFNNDKNDFDKNFATKQPKYEKISVKFAKYTPIVTTGQPPVPIEDIETMMGNSNHNRLRFDDDHDDDISIYDHHQQQQQQHSFLFQPYEHRQPQQQQQQSKRKFNYKLFDIYPEISLKQQQRQQQLTPKMKHFYQSFNKRNPYLEDGAIDYKQQQQIHLLVDPEYYHHTTFNQHKSPFVGTSSVGTDSEPINLPVITRRQPPVYIGQSSLHQMPQLSPPTQPPTLSSSNFRMDDYYFRDFYQSLNKFYSEQQRKRQPNPMMTMMKMPTHMHHQREKQSPEPMMMTTMMMMMMDKNDDDYDHHHKYPIIS